MEKKELRLISEKIEKVKKEVKKVIVGQEKIIDSVIKCLICNGHVLLEGVPGVAKTLLIRSLAQTIKGAKFSRIQFTPDLLPTDITGTMVYEEKKGFYASKGPIFANIVLADEINRAPPKVQSAMLQAMQERQVTIGKETFDLPKPFFVLATQNPLEQKGVYPLAVAQVDRFLFKLNVGYPSMEEELQIIEQNTVVKELEEFGIEKVFSLSEITQIQEMVKKIFVSDRVKDYITGLVDATRYPSKYKIEKGKYIQWGASPRASIYLALAARATALMKGRDYVIPEDVREVSHDVLRHRIILTYEGKAREIRTEEVIDEIVEKVPVL